MDSKQTTQSQFEEILLLLSHLHGVVAALETERVEVLRVLQSSAHTEGPWADAARELLTRGESFAEHWMLLRFEAEAMRAQMDPSHTEAESGSFPGGVSNRLGCLLQDFEDADFGKVGLSNAARSLYARGICSIVSSS